MSRRVPGWAFLSMGVVIAAAQGLFIRLLLVSFSGNELSIGLILGSWMLGEALGSHLAGHWKLALHDAFRSFLLLQLTLAVALPVAVSACYLVRSLAGVAPGEALGLAPMWWTSLLLLSPLSAVHGAMFSVGSASYRQVAVQDRAIVGRLYVYEALGAMCGGVALTLALVPFLNPLQTGLLLALIGLLSTLALVLSAPRVRGSPVWIALSGLAATLCLYVLLSPQSVAWHRSLVQARWTEAYHVVYERDSPYANVAVTQLLGQYTFLVNGAPILTTPFPDIAAVEEMVHLPLLFHPGPRRVLVVGGGLGGVLSELLKYDVERVDYAELDPLLISAVLAFPTELTARELADPRLQMHNVDGRLLVNQMAGEPKAELQKYDVILVNLPYPSTLEINRYYTEEFFQLLARLLNERGLAVLPMPGSLSYIGPSMRDLNIMLRNGLQAVFSHVFPIPGDTNLWLASRTMDLASIPLDELLARWEVRTLATSFITTGYLQVRLDPQRFAWFDAAIRTEEPVRPNRDLQPSGVLYGLGYWSAMFAPATYRVLAAARRITLGQWMLVASLALGALGLSARWSRRRSVVLAAIVATTGFAGMIGDLTIVFVFQSLYGYAYQLVGLIIASFMAGLALGGWATSRDSLSGVGAWLRIRGLHRSLVVSEVVLLAYWLAMPGLLFILSSRAASGLVTVILLLLNMVGGLLVGLQFPMSSRVHLAERGEPGYTAGVLYAADLAGAFLGAVAVGIVLMPVLGVAGTCLLVAVLKASSLVLLLASTNQTSQIPGSG